MIVPHKSIVFLGLFGLIGTRGSSQTLAACLENEGYTVRLVSELSNPTLRTIDTLRAAASFSMNLAVLDVFSTRVRYVAAAAGALLRRRKIPYVAILRGGALLDRGFSEQYVLRSLLDGAGRIVTPSTYLQTGFTDLGYQVTRIPNAVDLDALPFQERQNPGSPVRLLWVRAFAPVYRPILAVQVVEQLVQRGIDASLTMIGPDHGLLRSTMREGMRNGMADRISIVGAVPNRELNHYFQNHDLLLNTTLFESFGNAVVEAAATGLPVISSAVGELAYAWKDNEDIFLVHGSDPRDFADRIADVVSSCDGRYRAVSQNARRRVEHYSLKTVTDEWVKLVDSL